MILPIHFIIGGVIAYLMMKGIARIIYELGFCIPPFYYPEKEVNQIDKEKKKEKI